MNRSVKHTYVWCVFTTIVHAICSTNHRAVAFFFSNLQFIHCCVFVLFIDRRGQCLLSTQLSITSSLTVMTRILFPVFFFIAPFFSFSIDHSLNKDSRFHHHYSVIVLWHMEKDDDMTARMSFTCLIPPLSSTFCWLFQLYLHIKRMCVVVVFCIYLFVFRICEFFRI